MRMSMTVMMVIKHHSVGDQRTFTANRLFAQILSSSCHAHHTEKIFIYFWIDFLKAKQSMARIEEAARIGRAGWVRRAELGGRGGGGEGKKGRREVGSESRRVNSPCAGD